MLHPPPRQSTLGIYDPKAIVAESREHIDRINRRHGQFEQTVAESCRRVEQSKQLLRRIDKALACFNRTK